MKLNRVDTIGVQYVELERMAGTTILGLLAIKNNVCAFLHMLSVNNNIPDALNVQDLYGNTPLHYFALRGKENSALSAYLREMGACILTHRAHQSPHAVQVSRRIVCCEKGNKFGASYCTAPLPPDRTLHHVHNPHQTHGDTWEHSEHPSTPKPLLVLMLS